MTKNEHIKNYFLNKSLRTFKGHDYRVEGVTFGSVQNVNFQVRILTQGSLGEVTDNIHHHLKHMLSTYFNAAHHMSVTYLNSPLPITMRDLSSFPAAV